MYTFNYELRVFFEEDFLVLSLVFVLPVSRVANDDDVQHKVVESQVYEALVDYVTGRTLTDRMADLTSVAIANFSTYGTIEYSFRNI
jgi:hypothetical protein